MTSANLFLEEVQVGAIALDPLVVSTDPFQLHCTSTDVSAHFYVALLSPEQQQQKPVAREELELNPGLQLLLDHMAEKGSESAQLL